RPEVADRPGPSAPGARRLAAGDRASARSRADTRSDGPVEYRGSPAGAGRSLHYPFGRRALSNTRAAVSGSAVIEASSGDSASHTALAAAAPRPGLPHSPRPRKPSGLVVARTSW